MSDEPTTAEERRELLTDVDRLTADNARLRRLLEDCVRHFANSVAALPEHGHGRQIIERARAALQEGPG